jgi:anti-sigma B factor antagonist
MTIEIRQEQVGEVHVLALAGRLDTETSADLELALQDLQATGATRFVIDLGEIGYVSSAGLRVLLALAKQLDGGRGSLKLCALNEAVKQVFDVAGFSRLFAIFPDRDAALGAATPAPVAAAPASARAAAGKPKPQEAELARRAAELLGAGGGASGTPAPGSAELARTAAQLLGVSGKAKAARTADPPAQPAAPKPVPSEPAKPGVDAAQPGVLAKFRNLFGKK